MSYEPGNVCHLEIPAPDIPALRAFYSKLFGWTFQPLHDDYEFFDAGNIAGGLAGHLRPSEQGCLITVKTADVDAKLKEAEAAGGRILQPGANVPGRSSRFGYFADPCGNKLGVWME